MANILLGVTGSVAAIRAPDLYATLRREGYNVRMVATRAAIYFFDPAAIAPIGEHSRERDRDVVSLDEDEWPAARYERGDAVLHIELRRWADLLLVAPLDANTLAKFATGLSDNCLTCVWRAWDHAKPVVLAPAMNTLMWEHPLTRRHLGQVAADAGVELPFAPRDPAAQCAAINDRSSSLRIVPPQVKLLACGDTGMGGMADVAVIVAAIRQLM